jgi:CheY-like chemotaxis protein
MISQYLTILAKWCKTIFCEMTKTEVIDVKIKRDERPKEIYALAKIIPYEDMDKKLKGSFILGFTDESMAILVASAIAENLELPPITQMGDVASDILNEFTNIIVGRTISEWDTLGFKVKFSPPVSMNYSNIPEKVCGEAEAYMIILQLEVDYVVFRVTFNKIKENKLLNKRILVVDDSSVIRGILAKAIKQRKAEVEVADDGLAAIEKYQAFRPDLTIMDINMPRMGGLDSIVKIREFDPKAKFVILSSSSRKDEIITAKTLNVTSYVIKPLKMDEFLDIIVNAVD